MVPVFKYVGERSTSKQYHPISLLSVVSQVFEKLVHNRFVDQLEKSGLLSDFQYGFRSSWSTIDLLSVVSDSIAWIFNRSRVAWAIAIDISKAFERVWDAGLLHKLNSYGILGQILTLFCRFSVIDDFKLLWKAILHKDAQLMLEFLKAPFLI